MTPKRFRSIWDALETTPADADAMRARAALMTAIRKAVQDLGVTQAVAAKRLGVSQPRLNDLLKGKIDRFSIDALVTLAAAAGLRVTIRTRRAA